MAAGGYEVTRWSGARRGINSADAEISRAMQVGAEFS